MFRISKVKSPAGLVAPARFESGFETAAFEKYCVVDEWGGDLANGLFQLGALSAQLHGVAEGECGLLTLLRCYEATDRVSILELLENASSSASSFCFSTHIITGPGERQPLICIGESAGFGESGNGRMHGIFIFPRMPVDVPGH